MHILKWGKALTAHNHETSQSSTLLLWSHMWKVILPAKSCWIVSLHSSLCMPSHSHWQIVSAFCPRGGCTILPQSDKLGVQFAKLILNPPGWNNLYKCAWALQAPPFFSEEWRSFSQHVSITKKRSFQQRLNPILWAFLYLMNINYFSQS